MLHPQYHPEGMCLWHKLTGLPTPLSWGKAQPKRAWKEVKPQDKAHNRNKWLKCVPMPTSKGLKQCKAQTTRGPKIPSDVANAPNLPVGLTVTAEVCHVPTNTREHRNTLSLTTPGITPDLLDLGGDQCILGQPGKQPFLFLRALISPCFYSPVCPDLHHILPHHLHFTMNNFSLSLGLSPHLSLLWPLPLKKHPTQANLFHQYHSIFSPSCSSLNTTFIVPTWAFSARMVPSLCRWRNFYQNI